MDQVYAETLALVAKPLVPGNEISDVGRAAELRNSRVAEFEKMTRCRGSTGVVIVKHLDEHRVGRTANGDDQRGVLRRFLQDFRVR